MNSLYDLSIEEDELIVECLQMEVHRLLRRIRETEVDAELNSWDCEKWCNTDRQKIKAIHALIGRIGY